VPGYLTGGPALTALPAPDHDLSAWEIRQASVTRRLEEGDVIDLGNRHFATSATATSSSYTCPATRPAASACGKRISPGWA
jgi:hypothetical protein